jgi:hypothetical protein
MIIEEKACIVIALSPDDPEVLLDLKVYDYPAQADEAWKHFTHNLRQGVDSYIMTKEAFAAMVSGYHENPFQ